jgi:hypothetical protein
LVLVSIPILTLFTLVATYASQVVGWYDAGEDAGWIGSMVSAFFLLWIYQKFKSRSAVA